MSSGGGPASAARASAQRAAGRGGRTSTPRMPARARGLEADVGVLVDRAVTGGDPDAARRFEEHVRLGLVAGGVLGRYHGGEPVGDPELPQRPLDQMTEAARGDRQLSLGAVAARDRDDRLDRQDVGAFCQAGEVGALLLLGDGDRVQVQAGRRQQLRGDLRRGPRRPGCKSGPRERSGRSARQWLSRPGSARASCRRASRRGRR